MAMPVVLIPGILGTRLVARDGGNAWDPDDTFFIARSAWHVRKLVDLEVPLFPNPVAGAGASIIRQRRIQNGGHVVWSAYDKLLEQLTSSAMRNLCGEEVRVYCAGYDWRQSNRSSAVVVGRVMARALRETGAAKAVLIAHSMGGLVARCLARAVRIEGRRAEELIRGLILLGSPTHGAPATYRILRQSFVTANELADIDLELADEAGLASLGRHFAQYARRFPSVHEMLPGRRFARAHPTWVEFSRHATSLPDASDAARLYLDRHTGIPGVTSTNFRAWDWFDRNIGGYVPPHTRAFYSSGYPTETMYRIVGRDLEQAGRPEQNRGDERVPVYSGSAVGLSAPGLSRVNLASADHGAIANGPSAVLWISRHVGRLCRGESYSEAEALASGADYLAAPGAPAAEHGALGEAVEPHGDTVCL